MANKPMSNQKRTLLLSIYIYCVIATGIIIIWAAFRQIPGNLIGVGLFALMAALAELGSVSLFANSRSRISTSGIIAMAAIMIFGPLSGALIQLASGLMTSITTSINQKKTNAKGKTSWIKRSSFNIGMFVIAAGAAGEVYQLTGGTIGKVYLLTNLLPLLLAGLTSVLLNMTILIGVVRIQTGEPLANIWKRDFQWSLPLTLFGEVIMGGILALAYERFQILGLAIFVLPLVALTFAFQLYVMNMKEYVNRLEELNQTLEDINMGLLETLGNVIDAFDIYTYGHSSQVAVYARALAEKMNLPDSEIGDIVRAALVHDVGKVGITDSIIGKPGKLGVEEYNIIKLHPTIGAGIISQMYGMQNIVPLVKFHHERWDGKGYPEGLEGEKIPLGARILAVADALDALCSDRPYRSTMSFRGVQEEIQACSGTQFDKKVVEAFLQLTKEKGVDFFKNSAMLVNQRMLMKHGVSLGRGNRFFMKKAAMLDN